VTPCLVHPGRTAVAGCAGCGRAMCATCGHPGPAGWTCMACLDRPVGSTPPPALPRPWQPTAARPAVPAPPRRPPSAAGQLGRTPLTPTVVAVAAINTVIFVITRADPQRAYDDFAMIPVRVHEGQWYRLVTGAFLHVSTEHLAFNMLTLLVIGAPVETLLGRSRFCLVYLLSGLGGSVCSYLLSPPTIEGIGASGAIFGLFGAYVVLARRLRFDVRTVTALIVIELVLSFLEPGIDWRAHVGGLVVGVGYSAALGAAGRRPSSTGRQAATTLAALGILALFVLIAPGQVDL
jgi:membrane associated rhomboid family serine protease